MPIALAFVVIRLGYLVGEDERRRLRRWAIDRLAIDVSLGSDALYNFWMSALEHGSQRLDGISLFKDDEAETSVLAAALYASFSASQTCRLRRLTTALFAAARCVSRAQISELTGAALARHDVAGVQRTAWRMVAFALAPQIHFAALQNDPHIREAQSLFGGIFDGGLLTRFRPDSEVDRLAHAAWVIRLLGPEYPPQEGFPSGIIERAVEMSYRIDGAIGSLAQSPNPIATETFRELVDDPSLASCVALSSRGAAKAASRPRMEASNADGRSGGVGKRATGSMRADLRAVALDVLEGLRRELRTAGSPSLVRATMRGLTDRSGGAYIPCQTRGSLLWLSSLRR